MTSQIEIRKLSTIAELHEMQKVEESVWNMSPNPIHQTYTASYNGGVILGAYLDEKMVGFLYSFAGFNGNDTYLCSHMLGILPEYRKDGLGMRMKLKQAETALELGYSMITWTFDPLESLNAYLNIHKLGARGVSYKVNHYGLMEDQLNQGLPTDRIQLEWYLQESLPKTTVIFDEKLLLLGIDKDGYPIAKSISNVNGKSNDGWFVAIPARFQSIKQENFQLAKRWRYETRKVFQTLFEKGYVARDVLRDHAKQLSYYYFSK